MVLWHTRKDWMHTQGSEACWVWGLAWSSVTQGGPFGLLYHGRRFCPDGIWERQRSALALPLTGCERPLSHSCPVCKREDVTPALQNYREECTKS